MQTQLMAVCGRMPSECLFEFDRGNPIYYSGETVKAKITLTTESDKTCREVYLEFKGEAKVRWVRKSNKKTTTFRGHEIYISNHTTLHSDCNLVAGIYTYHYDIKLPTNAPSSCVARYGQINYELTLVIDRPYRFDNVFRRPITVLKNYDLNLNRELLLPVQGEDIKNICCFPCKSGPIIITVTIPYGGYAPGQSLAYHLNVDNQSSGYDCYGARLRLMQTYTFKAHRPLDKERTTSEKMSETELDQTVLRLSKRILEGFLYIPAVPPSSQTETIVSVKYDIEVAIKTGRFHRDSKLKVPIKIGTVPLFETLTLVETLHVSRPPDSTAQTTPTDSITPIESTASNSPSGLPPSYENLGPPRYEESVLNGNYFVDTEIDPHHRVDGFLPRYPMYNDYYTPSAPEYN